MNVSQSIVPSIYFYYVLLEFLYQLVSQQYRLLSTNFS